MTNLLYKPLIISHAGCMDGLGALLAAQLVLGKGNFDIHLATYGSQFPDVTDRIVYIFDFSYSRDVMLDIIACAKEVCVVDHHATAEETLKDLPCYTLFDKSKSGAVLAYEFLMQSQGDCTYTIPEILRYIQDRDLWTWEMELSKEINEYLRTSIPYTDNDLVQSNIDELEKIQDDLRVYGWKDYAKIGADRLKQKMNVVENVVSRRFLTSVFLEHEWVPVMAAFSPNCYTSEVGGELAKLSPTKVGVVITGLGTSTKFGMSIRGTPDSGDLAKRIAQSFGGGGHDKAAGCGIVHGQLVTIIQNAKSIV